MIKLIYLSITYSAPIFRAFTPPLTAGLAEIGKTTKGWFFGFKLHLIIKHRGEVCSCQLSTGNINDREPVIELTKFLQGKLFGDKGYIDQKLCAQLLERGICLVTGIKKNMKNKLLSLWDKILLRQNVG